MKPIYGCPAILSALIKKLKNPSPNINFSGQIFFACLFSIFLTAATIVGLISRGLNFGIDFSGGVLLEIATETSDIAADVEILRQRISPIYPSSTIQHFQHSTQPQRYNIMLRIHSSLDKDSEANRLLQLVSQSYTITGFAASSAPTSSLTASPPSSLQTPITTLTQLTNTTLSTTASSSVATDTTTAITSLPAAIVERLDYVGPKAGKDFFLNALKAVGAAMVVMLIYIWCRFEWNFAIGVIISLLHDAFITLGFYMVTGYEFDLTSVAAILTIIGYSVNDSVVIYDRIRDNRRRNSRESIQRLVDRSLNETLSRTVMTVGTTLAVCLALVFYGGSVLLGFSSAVLFGIAFGTYSSLYISTAVLLPRTYFATRMRRLSRWGRGTTNSAAT